MTKLEITEKSNSYKRKVLNCERSIHNFHTAIESFNKIKDYMEYSKNKVNSNKTLSLVLSCIFSILAIINLPFSVPVSILFWGASIAATERCLFFNRTSKKFDHCINYINKVTKKLSKQQEDFIYQRDNLIEEIIKLEKTIPDVLSSCFKTDNTPKLIDETVEVVAL